MSFVETAKGPIDSSALGRVLMHEHIFVISPEIQANYPAEWGDDETRIAEAVAKFNDLKASGIDTILDPTALGLGRYIPRIAAVAERIELNILVATGLYTFNELPFYFRSRPAGSGPDGSDPMTEAFVRDITDGIADTGIKAAVLKCATDRPGVTPDVERTLRAVARAHRRTGCPITTHTHAQTRRGLDQQEIFKQEGVDLGRVVIGHSGDSDDLDYLLELIDNGSYLGMDRFGIDGYLTTAQRVEVIAELCRRGHADRLVLSHDASCYIDWIPGEMEQINEQMPNWHYLHISEDVLPALRQAGVSDADIDLMLVDNPRRYFDTVEPY